MVFGCHSWATFSVRLHVRFGGNGWFVKQKCDGLAIIRPGGLTVRFEPLDWDYIRLSFNILIRVNKDILKQETAIEL